MTRTTVYLDAGQYRTLKSIARRTGQRPAALIRRAVAEFAEQHRPRPQPRSLGVGRSGRADWASRYEEHLKGLGNL